MNDSPHRKSYVWFGVCLSEVEIKRFVKLRPGTWRMTFRNALILVVKDF